MSLVDETPPTDEDEEPGRVDRATSKIGVWLVALLAVAALIAGLGAANSGPASPLLLGEAKPLRVTVPSIKASSTLIPLGQNPDRSLAVPPLNQPMQASWYDKSPSPGEIGPSVILGHVNGNGKPGIFADLATVTLGQQVLVDRADGQTATFTVTQVDTVPKDRFPTNQVYGDTSDAQLRLITCGGQLDRKNNNYLSNVVVYATLTSVRRT